MDLKSCAYAIQSYKHIDVLFHYIELAITFVIHLSVAIMRHGSYYETYTKFCSLHFEQHFTTQSYT